MRVLVIGSGGREHALICGLKKSPRVSVVFALPGNAGIAQDAVCLPGKAEDAAAIAAAVRAHGIGFVVVGPEAPLCAGVADAVRALGVPVFGPSGAAARLEGSKVFTKELCHRHRIPTGAFRVFRELDAARAYFAADVPFPCVVKADGLAAGKGVVIAQDAAEALEACEGMLSGEAFGDAGRTVLVEEFLRGTETSLLCLASGTDVIALASSRDHKRLLDGDKGPNTGGMGVISPNPAFTPEMEQEALDTIVRPMLRAMADEGTPFSGCFYAGLMLTPHGPQLLEVNVRFGDPETEAILPRLATDLYEALLATAEGRLGGLALTWDARASCTVILASGGYPSAPEKGKVIEGLEDVAAMADVQVFHAGTARDAQGRIVTAGGRVLAVTALGADAAAARARAYEACGLIRFEGMQVRTDIGA